MTHISYPDVRAESVGGRFRVEITGKSTDDFFRDQSGFVYKLFDKISGHEMWQWQPAENEGLADYPHEAWVNDQGWVVVRLHEWFHAGLLVLTPHGKLQMLRPMRAFGDGDDGILQDESDLHLGSTSAGPTWEAISVATFHEYAARPYWSICTWWRRRIVIDLASGRVVDSLNEDQESVVADVERSWIITSLADSDQLHEPDDRWSQLLFDC